MELMEPQICFVSYETYLSFTDPVPDATS